MINYRIQELQGKRHLEVDDQLSAQLTTIMGSCDLIRVYSNGGDLQKIDRHIRRIQRSVQNLSCLLEDFPACENTGTEKVCSKKGFSII